MGGGLPGACASWAPAAPFSRVCAAHRQGACLRHSRLCSRLLSACCAWRAGLLPAKRLAGLQAGFCPALSLSPPLCTPLRPQMPESRVPGVAAAPALVGPVYIKVGNSWRALAGSAPANGAHPTYGGSGCGPRTRELPRRWMRRAAAPAHVGRGSLDGLPPCCARRAVQCGNRAVLRNKIRGPRSRRACAAGSAPVGPSAAGAAR